MSIATLKKKTAAKFKNNSANLPQFSLNGVHRNQGFIGQQSLSRTNTLITTSESVGIKPSVLSSDGMSAERFRWVLRPQPFSSTKTNQDNNSTSSEYTVQKRSTEIIAASDPVCTKVEPGSCPKQKTEIPNATKTQGVYVSGLVSTCTKITIKQTSVHNRPLPG